MTSTIAPAPSPPTGWWSPPPRPSPRACTDRAPVAAVRPTASGSTDAARLPDRPGGFDYQLGGPYPPPPGGTIVERDRTSDPSGAGYDICYVNGFQTQPDESEAFAAAHPELVVQTGSGPLVDEGWPDEYLSGTSTADKRAALAEQVGEWIDRCAADGFAAVEIWPPPPGLASGGFVALFV